MSRLRVLRWVRWLVGPMVGVLVLFMTAGLALAQQQVRLTLQPVGGSGVSGTVTLDSQADGTVRVTVEGRGLVAANSYLSGAYNPTSRTCVGGRIGGFSEVGPGTRATWSYSVPGPIDNIFSVSIRQGTAAPGTAVACAERTAPAALPRAGGPLSESALWLAAGAAAILIGGGLLLRRRRAA